METFFEGLVSQRKIEKLSLKGVPLSDLACEKIARLLVQPSPNQLMELRVECCQISPKGMLKLLEGAVEEG
jgi:Ran GTPase-activating protein (RanGAP) involved in mRNA processing and transport